MWTSLMGQAGDHPENHLIKQWNNLDREEDYPPK